MYDQSFSKNALKYVLQKRDFLGIKTPHEQEKFREKILNEAIASTNSGSWKHLNPLISFPLKGRTIFKFSKLSDELVARKLYKNIKKSKRIMPLGRSQIVSNLHLLLEEGIPFKVYRLDIKSFYESFQTSYVTSSINALPRLSPQSKKLINDLLACHLALGGQGIPRGLSLSAALSDLLMYSFDQNMRSQDDIFFYSRYVDDIIVVTSSREDVPTFIRIVKKLLPSGLVLNQAKMQIESTQGKVSPHKTSPLQLFSFDYLGYEFFVKEPLKANHKLPGDYYRTVTVDVAAKKIMKFKTRISRSFLAFSKTGNFSLLNDRIKFLTKNFSVYNVKAGGKKIAGIFHSYPLVSNDAQGLKILDAFLKNAVLSKSGRVASRSSRILTGGQKRDLLAHSFAKGHANQSFVHFSGMRIKEIQECWKN